MDAGVGLYAVGALLVLFPAIMIHFDPREIWQRVEWADGEVPPPMSPEASAPELTR